MKFKNKETQKKIGQLKQRYQRRSKVLETNGREYNEVLSHAIWVYRRPLCRAMTRAILTLTNQHMGGDVGRILWRWRSTSVTSQMVSRVVIDLLMEHSAVTVSQVEAQCRKEQVSVRRTLGSKILNTAVAMGLLLVQSESREGREYAMSELMREELLDRIALKYTDEDVLNFARNVLMIHEMQKLFSESSSEKEKNPNPMDNDASLFEMALRGDFDLCEADEK